MRKVVVCFLVFITFIGNPLLYATSISEIEQELDALNSGLSELESDISSNTSELEDQRKKVDALNGQITELEDGIASEEVQVANLEAEIESLEAENIKLQVEKEKNEKEAAESKEFTKIYLEFLQITSKENAFLSVLFGKNKGTNVIQNIEATKVFTEASQEITNNLFEAIIEINAKTASIDENVASILNKKEDSIARKANLETQVASVSTSKEIAEKLENDINSQQIELLEKEADLRMQKQAAADSKQFLENAGCGPGDVYGVDCGETLPDGSVSSFIRPTDSGVMTCDWMCYDNHKGIDIGGYDNQSIYPSAPGIVTGSFYDSGGGNMVTVLHVVDGENFMTAYMHMNSSNVTVGQQVTTDTVLGFMGSTGMSTGTHLHFAIAPGVSSWDPYAGVDPRQYVNFPPQYDSYNTR